MLHRGEAHNAARAFTVLRTNTLLDGGSPEQVHFQLENAAADTFYTHFQSMKFSLQHRIRVGDDTKPVAELLSNIDTYRDELRDPSTIEGAMVCNVDGVEYCADQFEPILRLSDQWIRKLPWILGGDTETVQFRNSEHCFAFVPAGEGVEFSIYVGAEMEVEEYVLEPTTIRLDQYATESIRVVEQLVTLVKKIDPGLAETSDDARELVASLDEGRRAWREHQLRSRR